MVFVNLIIPVPLPNLFTYFVQEDQEDQIEIGKRVVVKFGASKYYTAIIREIHSIPPVEYQAKAIDFVLDDFPIVTITQLKIWDWMKTYYMCSPGEIMNAALPSGFKLVSETKVLLNDLEEPDLSKLTDKEYLVSEALQIQPILSLDDISNILGVKNIHGVVKSLLEKNVIILEEEVKERYKPKFESFISIDLANYKTESDLLEAFQLLKSAPKQEDLLMKIMGIPNLILEDFNVKRNKFLKDSDSNTAALSGFSEKRNLKNRRC